MTSDDKKNPNTPDINDPIEMDAVSPAGSDADDDLVVDFEIEGEETGPASDVRVTPSARDSDEEEAAPLSRFVEMSEEEEDQLDDAGVLYGERNDSLSAAPEDDYADIEGFGDDYEDDFAEYEDVFDDENGDDGDDDFDYDSIGGGNGGSRFKVGLMPAMLVLLAVGAGGYMIMNPQILSSGSKPKAVSQMSVEDAVSSVAQVSAVLETDLPQPNVNVNVSQDVAGEIPRAPQVSVDSPAAMWDEGANSASIGETDVAPGVTPESWQRDGAEAGADMGSGVPGLATAFGAEDKADSSANSGFEIVDVTDIPDTEGAIEVNDAAEPVAEDTAMNMEGDDAADVPVSDKTETQMASTELPAEQKDVISAPVEDVVAVDIETPQAPEPMEAPADIENNSGQAGSDIAADIPDGDSAVTEAAVEPVDVDPPRFPEQIAGAGDDAITATADFTADETLAATTSQNEAADFPDIQNLQHDVAGAVSKAQQQSDAMTVQPQGKTEGQAAARLDIRADAETVQPDTYYDSRLNVPAGQLQMQTNLPRKVDPTQEPASKFIVVKKTHEENSLESQIVAAGRALKLKRYDSAAELYDRLYERVPQDSRVLMGRAVAYQNLGYHDKALLLYEELLKKQPENTEALVNTLGILRQQYPEVALRRLKLLHETYPGKTAIMAQIGVTEADLGRYDEAMRYLGAAASQEPNNAKHMFNMAIVADRAGQVSKAIEYYEQALEIDSVYGGSKAVPRGQIYDRLSVLRRR